MTKRRIAVSEAGNQADELWASVWLVLSIGLLLFVLPILDGVWMR